MQVDLLDTTGKKIDKIKLPEEIFETKANPALIAQVVRVYLANQRHGTQSAKTRGEVSGSGRKIYRQKGTGRARHGDRYAPIFVGGGVAFPPKPRDFRLKISKKMRKKALFGVLSQKLIEKRIFVIEGLEKIKAKTNEMVRILGNLGSLSNLSISKKGETKTLLVLPTKIENLILAARNIRGVTLTPVALLNTYTILENDQIIFLKDSIKKLSEVFLKEEQEEQEKLKVVKVAKPKEEKTPVIKKQGRSKKKA